MLPPDPGADNQRKDAVSFVCFVFVLFFFSYDRAALHLQADVIPLVVAAIRSIWSRYQASSGKRAVKAAQSSFCFFSPVSFSRPAGGSVLTSLTSISS